MAKLICPVHGYYDAAEETCPKCRTEGRPAAPAPLGLSQDDLETEIGAAPRGVGRSYGDDETQLGENYGSGFEFDDETELGQVHRLDETEIEIVDEGPLAILWVTDGPRRGKIFPVKEYTVIGRTRGDIMLDSPKIGSSHAKFTFEEEQFFIWDLASRNGTFVNGERIRAATPLKENDQVKIGDYQFVFKTLP